MESPSCFDLIHLASESEAQERMLTRSIERHCNMEVCVVYDPGLVSSTMLPRPYIRLDDAHGMLIDTITNVQRTLDLGLDYEWLGETTDCRLNAAERMAFQCAKDHILELSREARKHHDDRVNYVREACNRIYVVCGRHRIQSMVAFSSKSAANEYFHAYYWKPKKRGGRREHSVPLWHPMRIVCLLDLVHVTRVSPGFLKRMVPYMDKKEGFELSEVSQLVKD
jgi:hypothetical protein